MIAMYKKMTENDALFGVVCVLVATLGLSLKAIFIKLVYQLDSRIDAVSILTLRFLFACPFFILFLYLFRQNRNSVSVNIEDFAALALLGVTGYYVPAILDFSALAYIPAGLERLILFLYPTFVVIISLFIRRNEISPNTILALMVSYTGVVLVFVAQAPSLNGNAMTGSLMVLGAAIVFAIYTVASVQRIQQHGSIRFAGFATLAATAASVIHAAISHGFGVFMQSEQVYTLIILMAIFSTVLPLLLMAEGVKRIGASSTSIISTSGPPVTLAIAVFALGESFSVLQAIGSALILVGVFFVSRSQPAQKLKK
ncbi:MAG: DMT family transporter [Gammaproteobacteria bacterium]